MPIDLLAQSAVLCCPNALRPKHSILSISFKVIMIGWRRAADSCEDSTLGRICKSAPTGGCHKFNGASGWVHVMPIDLLAQSAALCCPNALRPYKHSILSTSFTVIMVGWRRAADSCKDSTLGRICKSAPTGGCHKFNGASGWVHVMLIDLLAQSVALCCPNALRLYKTFHSIHFVYGNHDWVAQSGRFVRGLNFRTDMQIRPYGWLS